VRQRGNGNVLNPEIDKNSESPFPRGKWGEFRLHVLYAKFDWKVLR